MFKKIHCMYTNADQLSNKITELELRVQEHLPHIIGITEVKPKNSRYSMNEAEFSLEDSGNYKIKCTQKILMSTMEGDYYCI